MPKDIHSVTDDEWAAMTWLERADVMTASAEKARRMGLIVSSLALAQQASQFIQLHKALAD